MGDASTVQLSRRAGVLVASVIGEIDLATAPTLLDTVESELARAPDTMRVVVDLSEVSFIDSSGLNAFVRLERVLTERGAELRLVSPTDRVVRQVFEITHLIEPLRVTGSLDDALA